MIAIYFKRVFKSGFVNFWRNGAVAASSVFVMTVTLTVIGALILASAFLNASLADMRNKVDISVSMKPDATEVDVLNLKQALSARPEVKEVVYTSRADELANFRTRHGDNSLLLQSLDEVGNPFGARLAVMAKDPSQYDSVARFLQANDDSTGGANGIIDKISFKKDLVDQLVKFINATERVGWAVSIALAVMSILVTFNTISLAIYISREEISVMRLVGAGAGYVRGPFMVEGIIAGIIAALLALGLLYPAVLWVRNVSANIYGGINLATYYIQNFAQLLLILLVSGILLGIISSYLAIRKYLKI